VTIPLDVLSIETGFPNCGSLTCTVNSTNSTHVVLKMSLSSSNKGVLSISSSPFRNYRSEKTSSNTFTIQIFEPDDINRVEQITLTPISQLQRSTISLISTQMSEYKVSAPTMFSITIDFPTQIPSGSSIVLTFENDQFLTQNSSTPQSKVLNSLN